MKIPESAIENRGYFTWMGEDGIARTCVKENAEITLELAKENTESVNTLYQGKKFPILIDSRGIKSMSRDAREHFSTKGRDPKTNAFGIIIGSPISRVLGNFYLGINKPSVPTKLFNTEEEALDWLKQFVL
ncbi:MAG: hypothetical protein JNM96_03475 [Bacteroidia bacterium]|nr:hypothetical protein [Bacteroidia bacterium]